MSTPLRRRPGKSSTSSSAPKRLPFTYEMADNLFVAISTDTGSFQYPNTSARTYEIGAELVKAGVDTGAISQRMYESYPRRRIELLRILLNLLQFSCNDRVASFSLTLEDAERAGALPEDNEGIIDHIRAIEGVIAAAFIEELPEGKVRDQPSLEGTAGRCLQNLRAIRRRRPYPRCRRAGAWKLEEVEKKVFDAICNEIPLRSTASCSSTKRSGMTSHDVVAIVRRASASRRSAIAARSIRSPRACSSSSSAAAPRSRTSS